MNNENNNQNPKPSNFIGKLIEYHRVQKNMSRAELATKLGYSSDQFIYMLENGKAKIPLKKLRRLVNLLEMDRPVVVDLLVKEYKKEVVSYFN